MVGWLGVDEANIIGFYLVFLRVFAFWMAWPVLSGNTTPMPVKILLSLLISFLMMPAVAVPAGMSELAASTLVALTIKEILLGLVLGFICRFFSFGVAMGGHLISVTIGLSQGQLYNPQLGQQTNPFEEFYMLMGSLFFLLIQGHHLFLAGFAESFHQVSVFQMIGMGPQLREALPFFFSLMMICVQIASPILVTILVLNISMGIIGRAVPQINVLITSLPLNILAGLLIVIVSLPLALGYMNQFHLQVADQVFGFIKGL